MALSEGCLPWAQTPRCVLQAHLPIRWGGEACRTPRPLTSLEACCPQTGRTGRQGARMAACTAPRTAVPTPRTARPTDAPVLGSSLQSKPPASGTPCGAGQAGSLRGGGLLQTPSRQRRGTSRARGAPCAGSWGERAGPGVLPRTSAGKGQRCHNTGDAGHRHRQSESSLLTSLAHPADVGRHSSLDADGA